MSGIEVCLCLLEQMGSFNVSIKKFPFLSANEASVYGFLRKLNKMNESFASKFYNKKGYFMCPIPEMERMMRLSRKTLYRSIKTLNERTDLKMKRSVGNNFVFWFEK